MNYFEKRYIFYLEILKRITTGNECKISEKLSKVFCLTKENVNKINDLIHNATYERLKSSDMVRIHIVAIDTFCKNKGFFGDTSNQKSVLKIKFQALQMSEKINLCDCAEEFLSEYADNPVYACVCSLLQIVKEKTPDTNVLRRLAARGVRDAGLMYAFLVKNGIKETLCELNRSALFSEAEIKAICDYYSIKQENISALKKYGIGFGINNERV